MGTPGKTGSGLHLFNLTQTGNAERGFRHDEKPFFRDSLPALFAHTEFLVMPDPANEEIYFIQLPVLSLDELAECQCGDLPIGMVEILDQAVRREKIFRKPSGLQ